MPTAESYSRAEEVAHSFTAAIGVLAMLLGTPWLVVRAAQNGGALAEYSACLRSALVR